MFSPRGKNPKDSRLLSAFFRRPWKPTAEPFSQMFRWHDLMMNSSAVVFTGQLFISVLLLMLTLAYGIMNTLAVCIEFYGKSNAVNWNFQKSHGFQEPSPSYSINRKWELFECVITRQTAQGLLSPSEGLVRLTLKTNVFLLGTILSSQGKLLAPRSSDPRQSHGLSSQGIPDYRAVNLRKHALLLAARSLSQFKNRAVY